MRTKTMKKMKGQQNLLECTSRKLEQSYMKEQREIEKMNQTQQPLGFVNNTIFCYEEEIHISNDSERKQNFLKYQEKHCNN